MSPVLYEVLTTHMGVAPREPAAAADRSDPDRRTAAPARARDPSPDGRYRLTYQTDGNLVIYRSDGTPDLVDRHGRHRPAAPAMQIDGNFVIYDAANDAPWHTHTYGNPGAYLSMQNNGALVVFRGRRRPAVGKPRRRRTR